jgi:histidinol dehydrogenase/sulfopropanediol 3-dehydrogenase
MKYLKRAVAIPPRRTLKIAETVKGIVDEVSARGLEAVRAYSERLDDYQGPMRLAPGKIKACLNSLEPGVREALETAISNIRSFHEKQRALLHDQEWEVAPGIRAGLRFVPVSDVAVYVPGGRYPLPSTVLMGVIPAQVAGVRRIAVLSPPRGPEGIHPVVLGALGLLGIEEVWAMGGAHGVAAMALGGNGLDPVHMVVGPGNAYVTEAKRILFGKVGIDGLAGPSEVLVIADDSADPEKIAADLVAQAEHDPMSRAVLAVTSGEMGRKILESVEKTLKGPAGSALARTSWESNGVVMAGSLEEAIELANSMAPEHLELAVKEPREVLFRCENYGAAFLGENTTVAFGDYIAGTNHILPTDGSARFGGGVWVGTFLKALTHQELSRNAAAELARQGSRLADAEGLKAHSLSMRLRGEQR